MRLDLTDDEAEVLRDFLGGRLGSLSMEISHTDSPSFRRTVRSQRDALRRVHDALVVALDAREGSDAGTGTAVDPTRPTGTTG